MDLHALGWDTLWQTRFDAVASPGAEPARVADRFPGLYTVVGERGERSAEASRRLERDASSPAELPAVGDWVAVREAPGLGRMLVESVLERKTAVRRRAAGRRAEEQVLAANVDVALIVVAADATPSHRGIERYLAIAWQSGVEPVVVLTKTDLVPDADARAATIAAGVRGVAVHAVSAISGDGLSGLDPVVAPGRTIALFGPSGAGKSTLVNHFTGRPVQMTGDVRSDGKGRHTTVRRELVVLPRGAAVIDTPGLREVGLATTSDGIGRTFEDIVEVIRGCRFADCTHGSEPGCAVSAALEDGSMDPGRWASYAKLLREARRLETRSDARLASEQRRRWKSISRDAKRRARP